MTPQQALNKAINSDMIVAHIENERPEYIAVLVAQKLCAHGDLNLTSYGTHMQIVCVNCSAMTTADMRTLI